MSKAMKRSIVKIDEDKCNGCSLCVPSCAEGAIQIIDGKARLVGENLCDGLGACLGDCPQDAITIEQREADAFDEAAVEQHKVSQSQPHAHEHAHSHSHSHQGGCPGAALRKLSPAPASQASSNSDVDRPSRLGHWPVQLALVPPTGEIWQDADVLISADCVAFAMPDFHEQLLAGRAVAIACPKLDDMAPYVEKLTNIFQNNSIQSITVAHMEVPCCSGIVHAVLDAIERSGRKDIPVRDVTVTIGGAIVEQ